MQSADRGEHGARGDLCLLFFFLKVLELERSHMYLCKTMCVDRRLYTLVESCVVLAVYNYRLVLCRLDKY